MTTTDIVSDYRQLDAQKIIDTVRKLQGRIERRFPGSGLAKVVGELLRVAEETVARTQWIQKPHLPLRCAAAVLSVAILALFGLMVFHIPQFQFNDFTNFIQALDASINSIVFIGPTLLFLLRLEPRI